MKKGILTLCSLLLSISIITAQKTETRSVDSFSKLEIGGVFAIELKQGNEESVVIEARADQMAYIITESRGDKLVVKMKDKENYKKWDDVKVTVNFKSLDYLNNNGVGSLKSIGTLKFDNLELKNASVGKTKLTLQANKVDANISSVGNTELSGTVKTMRIKNSSVGNLRASDLKVDYLDIRNSAVGSAEVYAEKELSITNEGVGGLRYKGNAVVKEMNSSGLGRIRKM
ncbi:MAG: head GIN domain-containing protein [Bacteroidota bacterium]